MLRSFRWGWVAVIGVLTSCEGEEPCTLAGAFMGAYVTVSFDEVDVSDIGEIRVSWIDPDKGDGFVAARCIVDYQESLMCRYIVDVAPRLMDYAEFILFDLSDGRGVVAQLWGEFPHTVEVTVWNENDELVARDGTEMLVYDQFSQPNGARCDGKKFPYAEAYVDL